MEKSLFDKYFLLCIFGFYWLLLFYAFGEAGYRLLVQQTNDRRFDKMTDAPTVCLNAYSVGIHDMFSPPPPPPPPPPIGQSQQALHVFYQAPRIRTDARMFGVVGQDILCGDLTGWLMARGLR